MYEDAIKLAESRNMDIQNDKSILQALSMDSSLSVPEVWDKIVHIRNGSIKFAACNCFLKNKFGESNVDYVGDLRVVFSLDDIIITLPGLENIAKQQIVVDLKSLPKLLSCPNKAGEEMNATEKDAEQYASLLRRRGSAVERVRMRVPDSKLWSDMACKLYYFFVLYPSDVIHGRDNVEYWDDLKEKEHAKRRDRDRVTWADWNTQRKTVLFFKKEIYPKLKSFGMPVFIQVDQRTLPVDKFFSLAGY